MKKVNLWKTLFLSALAVAAFTGCSNDDSDEGGGMPSITVDGAESARVAVGLNGGKTDAVTIESSGDWTITFEGSDVEDCVAVPATGSKGKTSVYFELGTRTAERTITAKVVTYGTIAGLSMPVPASVTITILQNSDGSAELKTNVAEIRALLKAMNPTEKSTAVTSEIAAMTITGIVVSDGAGNNLSNQYQIAVQDAGTDANSGLLINTTAFGTTTKVTPGQVLTAQLTNGKVMLKNGCIQLGLNDDDFQLTPGTAPDPIVITPDKIGDYEAQFVRIENCQPVLDYVGKGWYSGSREEGGNVGNVTFELLNGGETFLVFSSSYASYSKANVPENSGYIQGISMQYKGTLEICPRFAADLEGLKDEYQGPDYKTGTISQLKLDEYWQITGSIVAVNTSSFLLADKTGYVLVYNSKWTSQTDNTYKVGQKVTVKGKIAQFPEKVGLLQFSSPTITDEGTETFDPGQAAVFDAAGLTAYESDMKYEYVTLSGILNIAQGETSEGVKYYNYTVSVSGYNGKTVTLAYAFEKDFTDLKNGDVVDVKGFASGTNFDQTSINIMLTSIEKNTSTAAVTITTTPTTFSADGGTQDIAFTVANAGSNKTYAKIEGTGFSVPTGEVTSPVKVTAEANTGEAREATLTIYLASEENGTAVVESSIKLSQLAPLAENAKQVTFDYNVITEVDSSVDGISIACVKNNGNPPAYNSGSKELRIYRYNSFTLSAAKGKIQKVELTFSSDDRMGYQISVDSGSYTDDVPSLTGTWQGDAASVKFTNNGDDSNNVQARIKKIVVTYVEE